jgi:hypothetical protein
MRSAQKWLDGLMNYKVNVTKEHSLKLFEDIQRDALRSAIEEAMKVWPDPAIMLNHIRMLIPK